MSHTVPITMIADLEINLCGSVVNINDIDTIKVDNDGKISAVLFWQNRTNKEETE